MDDIGDGYPMVELDSDLEDDFASSSEDEIEVLLHGTPKQKRALRRRSLGQKSSSEDDFEKEMDAELNQKMNSIAAAQNNSIGLDKQEVQSGTQAKTAISNTEKQKKTTADEFKDCYSDSEEQPKQTASSQPTDTDLLYDADLDDVDQQWVDSQRIGHHLPGHKGTKGAKQASTDAVLCCPACMMVLCRDCQRHSIYKNQFRAMFVMNCSVDKSELLRYPTSQKQKKKAGKKSKKQSQPSTDTAEPSSQDPVQDNNSGDTSDGYVYHPVNCTTCNTHVAMFDADEVYHFFNVLDGNG